jgi:hypothetical protein
LTEKSEALKKEILGKGLKSALLQGKVESVIPGASNSIGNLAAALS